MLELRDSSFLEETSSGLFAKSCKENYVQDNKNEADGEAERIRDQVSQNSQGRTWWSPKGEEHRLHGAGPGSKQHPPGQPLPPLLPMTLEG